MSFVYLTPCPFCGNDQVDVASEPLRDELPMVVFIVCPTCGARGPIAYRHTLSVDDLRVEAMRKWEMRVDE